MDLVSRGGLVVHPQLRTLSKDSSKCWVVRFFRPSQRNFLLFYNFHDLSRKFIIQAYKKCESRLNQQEPLDPLVGRIMITSWNVSQRVIFFFFVILVFWLWKITMKHFQKTVFVFEWEQRYIGGHCLCFAFEVLMWFDGFTTQWSSFDRYCLVLMRKASVSQFYYRWMYESTHGGLLQG